MSFALQQSLLHGAPAHRASRAPLPQATGLSLQGSRPQKAQRLYASENGNGKATVGQLNDVSGALQSRSQHYSGSRHCNMW